MNLTYLGLAETGFSAMAQLTARDFFNVNGVKTRIELALDYNLDLSVEGYG